MAGIRARETEIYVYDDTSTTWVKMGNIGDIEGPEIEVETEETTAHDSPDGWTEYVGTVIEGGEVSFEIRYRPSDAQHAWDGTLSWPGMLKSLNAHQFRIVFPDPAWANKALQFSAIVTGFKPKAEVKGVLTADVTLKVTGPVTEVSTA